MGRAQRADYGIDAPGVVVGLATAAVAGTVAGIWLWPLLLVGLVFWLYVAVMLWGSRVGKRRAARALVAAIPWRGDERVLDVGCGRGLLLLEAAKRLTSGRAVGVDLWSSKDQSGNRPEVTRRNAAFEGVTPRVEIVTGNATRLPFADASFDVVLSGLVLHNIRDDAARRRAAGEVARVVRPGGRTVILDIMKTGEYMQQLRAAGMADVSRSGLRPLFAMLTRIVTATKP